MGLRVPDHAVCAEILERCGPLAATSANLSGEPAFAGGTGSGPLPPADLLIDDGPTPLGIESTVVDLTAGVPRLLREGAISKTMLERLLGAVEVPSPR